MGRIAKAYLWPVQASDSWSRSLPAKGMLWRVLERSNSIEDPRDIMYGVRMLGFWVVLVIISYVHT